jgi:Na+-driven multidrug efflux pump
VLAFVLEAVFVLAVLLRRGSRLTLVRDTDRTLRRTQQRAILRVARATFGERGLYHGAYLFFAGLVAHLGDVAMAAHQALIAIEAISFTAAEAGGIAAGALVAQKLGAGRPVDAHQTGRIAVGLGASALTVVSLAFLLFPGPLVRIFSTDPDVVRTGALCLGVAAIAQPLMAMTDTWAGALRGAGDTFTPMVAALVGPVLVRTTCCWVLAFPLGLGLLGIWIGSTLDWAVRAVWLGVAFERRRWARRALVDY